VEHFSAVFRNGRQRILFDLSHLSARHCGSSEFALSLLLHVAPLLEEKYDLNLLLTSEGAGFFGPELTGYRIVSADRLNDSAVFDLVYKPAQFFLWPEWYNAVRWGARLAYTHLDVIATRCNYLCGPNTRDLFRTAAEFVDLGFTISEFSRHDFEALYGVHSRFEVIHLGAPETPSAGRGGEYVLVVGNGYPHKAVNRAVDALRGVGPIVALGGDSAGGVEEPGVLWKSSGLLSRRRLTDLYEAARVVVCPSIYEGFGLPVLEALAYSKPVVALDLEVNRELAAVVQSPDFHLAPDFGGIRRVVQSLIEAGPVPSRPLRLRSWNDTAREYADAFKGLLDAGINIDLVNRRWKLSETLDAYHPLT
jgi:glycosyltransferase involved in cell wall biosynthesis